MNDAQRCRRNGWEVGDVLEDPDGNKLRLTAIGEFSVLTIRTFPGADYEGSELECTLSGRRWRRIGRWNKRTRKVEGEA